MLEELITKITSEPLFMVIAAVIVLFIAFSILKKLFKMAGVLVLVAIGFLLYVHFTGGDVQSTIERTMDKGKKAVQDVSKKAKEVSKDVGEQVKDLQDQKE